ncbi:hypothetical protein Dtox_3342 [Desulfofarcimen acetoxidans DSM 771]|uniref:DUF4321 domain-containing protein n=1 Tax=Desulfofarcimen acetoxidans (strain ATCC 49208 / DSM 771 / KCTC 5769 / VKM B-1644 / 5575) TaxID=485916 RepID=C8W5S3_DESAS|nr:DUF4321 domain-containing protein [Desulfofarcimen acetoxidans]ACV64073.1 hypothetical protein Dtox_3342 [Desulfofarcimen acetoxidans DSM 771]
MAKINRGGRNNWTLFLLLMVGGISGSAVGAMLAPKFSWLKSATAIGFPPTTLDLSFLDVTFGVSLAINPLTILGLGLAYLIYQRT